MSLHLLLCWVLLPYAAQSVLAAPVGDGGSISVVDLRSVASGPTKLAVLSAAGLDNRAGAAVFAVGDAYDAFWLGALLPNCTSCQPLTVNDYLASAYARYGGIRYDSNAPNNATTLQLPSVVTLAGLLDCVPIDQDLFDLFPSTKIVLDTRSMWSSAEEAVKYAAAAGLNRTSSLAMQDGVRLLTGGFLADWIVSRRLFVMYLTQGCVPFTADNALLRSIITASPWPRPVRVYGYNSLDVVFGGDLFEAETDCVNTMGQIASAGTNNLAFWQHVDPLDRPDTAGQPPSPLDDSQQPVALETTTVVIPQRSSSAVLQQVVSPPVAYERNTTYIALVYGDMDNIDFVRSFGSDHMRVRVARCSAPRSDCFPLTWTLSPNLIEFAPAMMRWYFAQAQQTGGRDWFIMPPSGTLYSYPGEMPSEVQAAYVEQQNAQALIMNTSGTIHWEWMLTWHEAWSHYFPRYVDASPIGTGTRAFFLNDVPWVVPIPDMYLEDRWFRFVGEPSSPSSVVGFRPAMNWQEGSPGGGNPGNSTQIAALISALPRGTVTYVYVIQNTNISSVFDMAAQLQPHVQLVGYQQLVDLARQAAMDERR